MTSPAPELVIVVDDLSGAATQALIAAHLAGMFEESPPESVHALDLEKLRDPSITFWSGWIGGELAVIGALKRHSATEAELKSMRADDAFRGAGAGRAILRHILAEASASGITRVSLETGSQDAFLPARRLYASEGFVECGPFADYVLDPASVFMTREL